MLRPPSTPVQGHASSPVRSRRLRALGLALVGLSGLVAVVVVWVLAQPCAGRGDGLPERLRVGFAVEAPYAFLAEDGRVTGESPEIARRVAAELGYGEPEWVLAEFGSLVRQLREGRFDVVAAGLFVTAERGREVAFSRPTMSVQPALLVAAGNPRELYSYADVARWGHVRVAAVVGSVEEGILLAEGVPAERLVVVPDAASGVALLKSGRVDGLALSRPTVSWFAGLPEHFGMLETAEPFTPPAGLPSARVAFAFRPEDTRLRREWDAVLAKFLGSAEHRGILRELGIADAGAEDVRREGGS